MTHAVPDTEGARASELARLRSALEAHMAARKPKRYRHSLGVAACARDLALAYGVDPFEAEAAGLLHDWEKVWAADELTRRAARFGVLVPEPASETLGLVHGPLAAAELPGLFPELPPQVFQAIERHTVGAVDMTPLDMAVFVADAIEPGRGAFADPLRELVGARSLEGLFLACVARGIAYILETGRYLYPPTVDVYDAYALRARRKENA